MFKDFIAIGLFVRDFDKIFDFYKNVLKLKVKTKDITHKFAEFQIGDVTIGLVTENTAKQMFELKYFEKEIKKEQSFTLTVETDSIDRVFHDLKSLGAVIISEPRVMPWGWRLMCIKDPEGYIWEICELPKVNR